MATTKPMPDFIRQKIEERKAEKAAREAEEAGEEPEAEEAEEPEEVEEAEEEEKEKEEEGEEEEEAASPRKNGLSPFRKNGLPSLPSSSPTRRRRRSFDPGRSFDDAAKWVMKNKVPVLVGLGVVGLFWLASKSKKAALPPRYAYGVRGAFADPASAAWQPNSTPVMTSHATGGDFRTGIQSSSPMWDARYFDYPDYVEAYWDPIPE